MADRQHKLRDLWVGLAVALIIGGPGLSLGIWGAEHGTAHVGFWPHAGEVAGLALVAFGIYFGVAVGRGWWLPGGFAPERAAPAPPDLATRAEALARDLYDFLADRQRDEPQFDLIWMTDNVTEQDRQRRWAENGNRLKAFHAETMTRYGQRFAGRAINVFEEAAAVGLAQPEKRWFMRHPAGTHGIENIAQQMSALAYEAGRR
jgi:hypothetical protein